MKIFLHIGMPKCGSSALQTWLSQNPVLDSNKHKFEYVAIKSDGAVLSGDTLVNKAKSSVYNYVSTASAEAIQKMTRKAKNKVMAEVDLLSERVDGLIISSEGWGPKAELFEEDCLLANRNLEVHAIMYVRPQVSWFNSAWWQWGAWTDRPFRRWINANKNAANWFKHAASWKDKKWINDLTVRLLPSNVVEDFSEILGVEAHENSMYNKSLPGSLLRLFQRNRELRMGAHDSAIDFILARHLELEKMTPPWILRPQMIGKIIDLFRDDNNRLRSLLSEDQSKIMSQDDRWWNPDAYESYENERPGMVKINAVEVEALAVAALKALERCDKQMNVLNERLREHQKKKQH